MSVIGIMVIATALSAPSSGVPTERIGVCSWSFGMPLQETANAMELVGVKNIQLALGPFISPDGRHGGAEDDASLSFVKDKIASGEWRLVSTMIATVGEDYSTLESIRKTGGIVPDEHWDQNKSIITAGARLTRELGAKLMSLHAGFLDENDAAALEKFIERVTWIRDETAKYGVQVMLETGQESADELAKFLDKVPGVMVNFDPANMVLYGKGRPIEALDKLYPRIMQVHIKDAVSTRVPGTWGTEVPWGEGEVGGQDFISALEKRGYSGYYVIERENGTSRAKDMQLAKERISK